MPTAPSTQAGAPFRVAISATFTADPIAPTLSFWGRELNRPIEARMAPYNQPLQTLLDPAGEFARNAHGVNVLLMRLEDLGEMAELERVGRNVQQLLDAVRETSPQSAVPLIFVLCPPSDAFLADPARAAFAKSTRQSIHAAMEDVPGVQFIDYEQIRKLYPVAQWSNPEGERLGHIPYTDLYFCALGTAVVRLAHGLYMRPYKVVALDCDNTLWQGICGEDGPAGVGLDPPRRDLQEFLLDQRDVGMLLCMASKNNEQDVLDTFAQHPEMPLQLRHFTAWRLNWEQKAINLADLAQDLNLGLDSFIFIDDNPKECAEVQESVPEVLTLALPEPVEDTRRFLEHVWAFDRPVVTEEDRNRSAHYAQSEQFGRAVRKAADIEQFMAALHLEVRIHPVQPERLARVAQLTQRTNQFNLTNIRRTEAEIRALLDTSQWECFTAEVSDRFGDYGLVGVMIVGAQGPNLVVDTFLLSCRALGRGVEHRMLAFLGGLAARRGLAQVVLELRPTAKNLPAKQFLESMGGSGGLSADVARAARWKPSAPVAKPRAAQPAAGHSATTVDYARIAQSLSTPEQILAAVRGGRAPVTAPGMTETERKLAEIWADLLNISSISVSDNFFDLGGHSLLAVLLAVRVKETFGIELPIDDVYSAGVTLAGLAAKVEAYQLSGVDPGEYAALLAEIESLSEEEVRALLDQEGSESPAA
jgi:FkbH-like protein